MLSKNHISSMLLKLNLQLFADGAGAGDGGTADGATTGVQSGVPDLSSKKGVKSNPLADVKYGIQPEAVQAADVPQAQTEPSAEDRNAKFEELIKGEYKDLYDARIQDTIQKRLKSSKDTVEKYNKLSASLEILGNKYGVDPTDADALASAIEEDSSFFEDEALERGLSVQDLKAIKKMERENAALKREIDERTMKENTDKIVAEWMRQGEQLKTVYPSFDLDAEMQNPNFQKLISNNIDMRTAFEVIHKDEIMPAAMQYTAKQVEQKLANKMMANNARPVENGIRSQASAIVKSDVSQLTKADRQEIARRVARGEKIRFG